MSKRKMVIQIIQIEIDGGKVVLGNHYECCITSWEHQEELDEISL